jgi:integrase
VLRLVCRRAVVDVVKAFSVDQLVQFITTAARAVGDPYAAMWRTQALSGLRPGEAPSLHVFDVADETGTIRETETLSVRRTVASSGLTSGTPKTPAARRDVEMGNDLRHFLKAYLLRTGLRAMPDAPLFGHPRRPGYLASAEVRLQFKKTLKAAGLSAHFTMHGLRHTYASIHLSRGTGDVYWLARQLGHADLGMTTAIYGSWLPTRRSEALERFDTVLRSAMQPDATRLAEESA